MLIHSNLASTVININKTNIYNINNEERLLIILLNKNLIESLFDFTLNATYNQISSIENKHIRYLLLHAYNNNIPISIAEIKDINNSFTELINYLFSEYHESEYLFKYIPILINENDIIDSNIDQYTIDLLYLENIQLLYNNHMGGLVYGYNQNINHPLYIKLPNNIRSVINYNNFYFNLYLCIELAKQRIQYGFSKPYHNQLLGYNYDSIITTNLTGFYDIKYFNTVLDYEYIMSAIVNLKYLIYRSCIIFKHRFFTYIYDIKYIIESLIQQYIAPILDNYNIELDILEDQNLLLVKIELLFKKPILKINLDIYF